MVERSEPFDLAVDYLVDAQGERPSVEVRCFARANLQACAEWKRGKLCRLSECWTDLRGRGYPKDWMWSLGAQWKRRPPPDAPKLIGEAA